MPRVPRPLSGCDVRSLPLSPVEAFLFSRIDGTLTEPELSQITGMTPSAVAVAIDRLTQLRAITVDAEPTNGAAASAQQRRAVPTPTPPPLTPRPAQAPPNGSARPRYAQAELDEVVEIEPDRKRAILDLYYRLDDLTYYDILGVGLLDDKKKIKAAYYAIAPEFHPDRFFRKQLGAYKQKIELIFARLTLAHDVLTSRQRREEYDDYLDQQIKNRSMSALLDQTQQELAKVVSSLDAMPVSEPARAVAVPSRPPEPSSGRASDPGPIPAARVTDPAEIARARREALARKLAAGRRPSSSSSSSQSIAAVRPESNTAVRAADALRARYDAAIAENKREQIRRYVTNGKASLEAKDFAAAANAFRIASSLAPDDAALAAESEEVTRLAGIALADGYWKQAQYEESEGRWLDAALSYAKVCNGRPTDAKAHERVAFTTLKSSSNVRRAVDFARKAVELEPRTPELRLTLARAYAAAGFIQSAKGEIDRAKELAPGDAKIAELCAKTREEALKSGKLG